MPRGAERIDRGEESKVDRLIRRVYEETRAKLLAELEPVEGDFRKILVTLQRTRNFIEVLIGSKLGDHPVCGVNDPREFFAEAVKARSSEIKELVSGEHLVALLAKYDEIAAVVVPLRAAVDDINGLLGKEPSEPAVDGRGRRTPEQSKGRNGVGGAGKVENEDDMLPRYAKARAKIRAAIIAEFRKSDVFVNSKRFYERLGCSILTSRREVAEMVKEGLLEVRGSGPSTRYVLTLKGRAEIHGDGVGGADGVMLGTFRYNGPHPAIARAICEKLQTGAAFVNSRAFCEEADCHSPASLQVVVALIEAGILTKEGNGRASIYPLTPRGKSLIRAQATRA